MNIYDFTVKDTKNNDVSFDNYKGKVLLIVNTATGCGFTPQYEGLEKLYKQYKDKGFEILDFPCNQFLGQAPGTNEEIVTFCQTKYGVSFKTFSKIDVNGENADPLYKFLKTEVPNDLEDAELAVFIKKLESLNQTFSGSDIKWNFTKFLIDKNGNIIARFAPTTKPEDIGEKIEELLNR
ncbi:glutathione peroxidase [Anaerocolumna sp.]|uniref:glutathione peroxidase n=1 Tax=Anaerocolumna sp. TaxID=2041569 RepID=UPI0028B21D1F|nr:glutathione peroxidase [Anaerocolumna sp.]